MKALTELSAGDAKLRLTAEQIETIRAAYADANESIRQRFFPDRAELFPERPGTASAPASQSSPEDVAARASVDEVVARSRLNRIIDRQAVIRAEAKDDVIACSDVVVYLHLQYYFSALQFIRLLGSQFDN